MKDKKPRGPRRTKAPSPSGSQTDGKSDPKASRPGKVVEILGRTPKAAPASRQVPAKWRWHYRVLLSLHDRLLGDRSQLRHSVTEPLEPHSLDEADSATDEFDHGLALTRLSMEMNALKEVSEALQRIMDGSYGQCAVTGKAIPAARLKAIPWTRYTREVEERLEKEGRVPRPRIGPAGTIHEKGPHWVPPEEEAEAGEEVGEPATEDSLLPGATEESEPGEEETPKG